MLNFSLFPHISQFSCELWKQTPKSLLIFKALISKIYSNSTIRTFLGYFSFTKKNAPPSSNFYLPKKQQFSCYNPRKTTFLAVVVAPVPFPFDVQYLQNGVLALKKV